MNTKVRAVFLAAIMAFSMIAIGGMALSGGAVAASVNDDPSLPADQERTSAEDLTILSGHTILDDIPLNGSAVYNHDDGDTFSNLAGDTNTNAAPVVNDIFGMGRGLGGSHTGITGLPAQDSEYQFLITEDLLNYQAAVGLPSQTIDISFDIVAHDDVDEETVVIDYSEATSVGLVAFTVQDLYNTTDTTNSQLHGQGLGSDGANLFFDEDGEANAIQSVQVDNAASEVQITYENDQNASVENLELTLRWAAADPVNGLWVDTHEGLDHVLRAPDGSIEDDRYRVVKTGATALVNDDAGLGITDQTAGETQVDDIDLDAEREADGVAVEQATAFHVWVQGDLGQRLTFVTDDPEDEVAIHEVDTHVNDDDEEFYRVGSEVVANEPSPAKAITWNAGEIGLEDGEQYFVTWGGNNDEVAVLDVRDLGMTAEHDDEVVSTDEFTIDVEANAPNAKVQAWFWEADDLNLAAPNLHDVVHVATDELDGPGTTTIRVSPEADLDTEGEFRALIIHEESEIAIPTGTFQVVEAEDARVNIVSPDGDEVVRGDIVPIELEFENTDTGTITFGDRDPNVANLEINVTVRDIDGSGTATVHLNTYQIGHGYIYNTSLETTPPIEPNDVGAAGTGWNFSRNHGFFSIDPGTALVGQDGQEALAHPNIDIGGGSQGHEVLGSITYEIRAAAGEQTYRESALDDLNVMRIVEPEDEQLQAWVAPGAGENEIDPEFYDDIEAGKDGGYITPAGEEVAEGDFFIAEFHADGLTGVFHDRIVRSQVEGQGELDFSDLFFREDDIINDLMWPDDVGDLVVNLDVAIEENEELADIPVNVEALSVSGLEQERLLGGTYDGLNFGSFALLVHLDTDDLTIEPAGRELEPGTPLITSFTLTGEWGGEESIPANLLRSTEVQVQHPFEFNFPYADIDRQQVNWDPVNDRVEIAAQENVTIHGITNVAAGSNLTVMITTKPGAGDAAFFQQFRDQFPEWTEERRHQLWDVTVADNFADAPAGTEFTIDVHRQGFGRITPGGVAIDGIVLEDPQVLDFQFEDQQSLGNNVVVDLIETNHGGTIQIQDADGTVLGESGFLAGGVAHENVPISVSPQLEDGDHDLTAVALQDDGDQYPENSVREATVTVGEDVDALFNVGSVSLSPAEIDEPGAEVTASAEVENIGGEGTQTITLSVDGTEQDSEEVTLGEAGSTTVDFTVDTSGLAHGSTVVVEIASEDTSSSATLSVAEEEVDEDDTDDEVVDEDDTDDVDDEPVDEDVDDDGAGFGVVIAALALLGAALLAVRRKFE